MSGDETTAQKVVRAQGMCGELLNDGRDICILEPGHGDHEEPESWADHDYVPLPRNYEKCRQCGDDLNLRHHCTLSPLDRSLIDQHFEFAELSRHWGPSGIYAKVQAFIDNGLAEARRRHDEHCEMRDGFRRFCDCAHRRNPEPPLDIRDDEQ